MKSTLFFLLTFTFLHTADLHASRTRPMHEQVKSDDEYEQDLRASQARYAKIIISPTQKTEREIDVLNATLLYHLGLQEDNTDPQHEKPIIQK